MDTTETYIKMCDTPDIQGDKITCYREPARGDWWYHIASKTISISESVFQYRLSPSFVWLPRQDQLQDMIIDAKIAPQILILKMIEFERESPEYYWTFTSTMEQLWLAFYMHEIHSKVWLNNKWVKEKRDGS